MKKFLKIVIALTLVITLSACSSKKATNEPEKNESIINGSNTVILYFSATNNTKNVAKYLSELTNADLIEIVPKEKYTSADLNYNDSNSRVSKEHSDSSIRPTIENELALENYDTIFLGYPIWWGEAPRIILTLLDNYNLEGKNIILFATSASSGIESSVNSLIKYNENLNIITSKRFSSSASKDEVSNWLEEEHIEIKTDEKGAKNND